MRRVSDLRPVHAEEFVHYLRGLQVAPNGHRNAIKRRLRDKGIKYILETCSTLFNYAARQRHLPPYAENPFRTIEISRIPVEDSKPIVVFSGEEEHRFLEACDRWQFPLFATLLMTGLRPGELTHLFSFKAANSPELPPPRTSTLWIASGLFHALTTQSFR